MGNCQARAKNMHIHQPTRSAAYWRLAFSNFPSFEGGRGAVVHGGSPHSETGGPEPPAANGFLGRTASKAWPSGFTTPTEGHAISSAVPEASGFFGRTVHPDPTPRTPSKRAPRGPERVQNITGAESVDKFGRERIGNREERVRIGSRQSHRSVGHNSPLASCADAPAGQAAGRRTSSRSCALRCALTHAQVLRVTAIHWAQSSPIFSAFSL